MADLNERIFDKLVNSSASVSVKVLEASLVSKKSENVKCAENNSCKVGDHADLSDFDFTLRLDVDGKIGIMKAISSANEVKASGHRVAYEDNQIVNGLKLRVSDDGTGCIDNARVNVTPKQNSECRLKFSVYRDAGYLDPERDDIVNVYFTVTP